MAFTKAYAKIMAGLLDSVQLRAFRVLAGKQAHCSDIPESTINELVALELIRLDSDGSKHLALLTSRGKKVAEFI
jgi:hypothetical protein